MRIVYLCAVYKRIPARNAYFPTVCVYIPVEVGYLCTGGKHFQGKKGYYLPGYVYFPLACVYFRRGSN